MEDDGDAHFTQEGQLKQHCPACCAAQGPQERAARGAGLAGRLPASLPGRAGGRRLAQVRAMAAHGKAC